MDKGNNTVVRGMYNSSITRVRPFFRTLFDKDRTGMSWLSELLMAMPLYEGKADRLNLDSAPIEDQCLQISEVKDRILGSVNIEECFEYRVPPSRGFLQWALENPEVLTWPENGKKKFGAETQFKRECLFGFHGKELQKDSIKSGVALLMDMGVYSSSKQWWAFEGFTEIDCLIETETCLIGVEGKRTEFVSASTYWYQERNQIVRNLEVLREIAMKEGKEYVFILINEEGVDPVSKQHFVVSLPHNEGLADELYAHYLGCLSWRDACAVTGISYDSLPHDITCIARKISGNVDNNFAITAQDTEKCPRENDHKLFRIHGKISPQQATYEAKLRNDLFMVGELRITTGKGKHRRIRIIGYEMPLGSNRDECIDLIGYDKDHNLYVVELKTNSKNSPKDVTDQLERYTKKVTKILGKLASEVRDQLLLEGFTFSRKIIKVALIPQSYHDESKHDQSQWREDVVVCSINKKTDTSNLVENRGSQGFVTLDIITNKQKYLETISK